MFERMRRKVTREEEGESLNDVEGRRRGNMWSKKWAEERMSIKGEAVVVVEWWVVDG